MKNIYIDWEPWYNRYTEY